MSCRAGWVFIMCFEIQRPKKSHKRTLKYQKTNCIIYTSEIIGNVHLCKQYRHAQTYLVCRLSGIDFEELPHIDLGFMPCLTAQRPSSTVNIRVRALRGHSSHFSSYSADKMKWGQGHMNKNQSLEMIFGYIHAMWQISTDFQWQFCKSVSLRLFMLGNKQYSP